MKDRESNKTAKGCLIWTIIILLIISAIIFLSPFVVAFIGIILAM